MKSDPKKQVSVTPVTIATNVLAALSEWACQEPGRPHISAVLFDRDNAVATDGHRLARLPIKTHGHRMLVDRQHIAAAVAAQRDMKVQRPREIGIAPTADGSKIVLTLDSGVTMTVTARDADQYPPWEKVIPVVDPNAGSPDGHIFNPRYMAAIAKLHDAMVPNVQRGVRVVAWERATADGGRLGPMLFEGENGAQFVVMPMREA